MEYMGTKRPVPVDDKITGEAYLHFLCMVIGKPTTKMLGEIDNLKIDKMLEYAAIHISAKRVVVKPAFKQVLKWLS